MVNATSTSTTTGSRSSSAQSGSEESRKSKSDQRRRRSAPLHGKREPHRLRQRLGSGKRNASGLSATLPRALPLQRPRGRDPLRQLPADGDPPERGADLSSGTNNALVSAHIRGTATRNLSANGNRVFFESPDAMLPADTNGVIDVYEWEAKGEGSCESESLNGGCLYLISSGSDPERSSLPRRLGKRRPRLLLHRTEVGADRRGPADRRL